VAEEALAPIDLHCRDEGEGPPLLLLHMVGGNHTVWNSVVPALAKEFRVLAPDLRGHGRTPAPPGSHFTFAELAGDVVGLLDAKSLESAHVVGLSGGALLALRLTLDRPARVRSLVLISGAGYVDNHTRAISQRWTETLRKEGPDAFALRLLKDLYYPDWIEGHLDFADAVRANAKRQDFGPAERWGSAMERFDERSRISGVRTPTLIVQAMDDQVVDASHGRILRQSIPDAQIRILAQTGHMVPLERPTETVEAIAGFVRAVEAKRGGPPAPADAATHRR
jgi:pimeloyl-ACP methyl ester carboxylesterase